MMASRSKTLPRMAVGTRRAPDLSAAPSCQSCVRSVSSLARPISVSGAGTSPPFVELADCLSDQSRRLLTRRALGRQCVNVLFGRRRVTKPRPSRARRPSRALIDLIARPKAAPPFSNHDVSTAKGAVAFPSRRLSADLPLCSAPCSESEHRAGRMSTPAGVAYRFPPPARAKSRALLVGRPADELGVCAELSRAACDRARALRKRG